MKIYDLGESKETMTVSEFISLLNSRIRGLSVGVTGEVSEMKMSGRGHAYPVIKDKETGDVLPCTMWADDYVLNGVELEVGAEILAKGHPEFYGPFGKLSFHISSFELIGEGQLKKAYDKLKEKLRVEGIFDEARKRPLPNFPKKIGVITSTRGEAIHDFSNNLRKSGFKIKILHSPVEGPESGRYLTLSVRYFRNIDIDVLVIIRGGGSMQSLAGFDNEALVRELASFPKPVVAGIGHHQDVPLASLVADVSGSTPSMVASVLNSSWDEANLRIERSKRSIFGEFEYEIEKKFNFISRCFVSAEEMMRSVFERYKESENRSYFLLRTFKWEMEKRKGFLIDKTAVIKRSFRSFIKDRSDKISEIRRLVSTNDPKKQMKMGYSLVFREGRIVKSKKNLKTGEEIDVKLYDGDIVSEIKRIK